MEHLQIRITAQTRDAQRNLDALARTLEQTGASLAQAGRQALAAQDAMQLVGGGSPGNAAEGNQADSYARTLAGRRAMEQQAQAERRTADSEYLAWRHEQWSAQFQQETALSRSATQTMQANYGDAIDTIVSKQGTWISANKQVSESLRDVSDNMLLALVKTLVQAALQAVSSAVTIERAMRMPALLTSLATSGANALGAVAGIRAASTALKLAETGYDGVVSRPTLFMVGEGYQPEHVQVKPLRGANLHGPATETGLARRLDRLIGLMRAMQMEMVRGQPVVQVVNRAPEVQTQVRRLDWARNRMTAGGYDGLGDYLAQ